MFRFFVLFPFKNFPIADREEISEIQIRGNICLRRKQIFWNWNVTAALIDNCNLSETRRFNVALKRIGWKLFSEKPLSVGFRSRRRCHCMIKRHLSKQNPIYNIVLRFFAALCRPSSPTTPESIFGERLMECDRNAIPALNFTSNMKRESLSSLISVYWFHSTHKIFIFISPFSSVFPPLVVELEIRFRLLSRAIHFPSCFFFCFVNSLCELRIRKRLKDDETSRWTILIQTLKPSLLITNHAAPHARSRDFKLKALIHFD